MWGLCQLKVVYQSIKKHCIEILQVYASFVYNQMNALAKQSANNTPVFINVILCIKYL